MDNTLHVLVVEDSEDDTCFLVRQLQRGGYQPYVRRVETREAMLEALQAQSWDIVFSDYRMPNFSTLEALTLLQEQGVDIPFIMVSGMVGEDRAVEVMKAGAHDYIMKDNLSRLLPAVKRELREAENRRQRQAADEERARLMSILEATPDLVAVIDLESRIHYLNQAGCQWLGFSQPPPYPTVSLLSYYTPWAATLMQNTAIPTALQAGTWNGELAILNSKGVEIPLSQVILTHQNNRGQIKFLSLIARNITDQKQYEQELQYRVTHDILTHLPNRTLLRDRLAQALASAKRERCLIAILFLDVDNFKQINDALGHLIGDRCLLDVAQRLANCIRMSDTLGRYGGDEFIIILSNVHHLSDVETVIKKIHAEFTQPLKLNGNDIVVTLSIGVSLYPQDGIDEESLLQASDTAMYSAKRNGRNQFRYYLPKMDSRGRELLTLEMELRQALEREEFVLYYQPQLDLSSRQITAVEALIRWQHTKRGLIPPRDFIPILEQTGLIVEVGNWVLDTACTQAQAWHTLGYPLRIAVNCSTRQFQQRLLETVHHTLQRHSLDPTRLELEVTESVVMQDIQNATHILQHLKEMGVTLAIDDFGTGYSSLAYLRRFPIHSLKIDCSFVRDIAHDPEDVAIAETILLLGRSLELEIVAEGVETDVQAQFFQSRQCQRIQGYWVGHPLPAEDLLAFLATRNLA
jgi:diguanylate cyclase (GGDEF)-like protein